MKPEAQALYQVAINEYHQKLAARWAEVRGLGLDIRSAVEYYAPSPFGGGGEWHYGKIGSGRGGWPVVRLERTTMTSRGYRKELPFNVAWRARTTAAVVQAVAS